MMPDHKSLPAEFDWRTTSFEGARREQLRRWAQLPLEQIILAIEEMQDIAQALGTIPADGLGAPLSSQAELEQKGRVGS